MFLISLLLLTSFCLSDQKCGQINPTLQKELGKELASVAMESDGDGGGRNRIVGGQLAPSHSIPWQAQLHVRNLATSSLVSCGGVVVAARYVMTAAHCASQKEMVKVKVEEVWLGRHNRELGGSRYLVAEVFIHPGRTEEPKAHDVALVKLARAISYTSDISPACLPSSASSSPRPGSAVVVSGWGHTDPQHREPLASELQYVVLRVLPMDQCKKLLAATPDKSIRLLHPGSSFCTLSPGKDHCKGELPGAGELVLHQLVYLPG